MQSDHVRNIAMDIVLTLLTCGFFNLYLQYRQVLAINAMIKEQKYSFGKWFLFTIITCGIYHFYHEYRKTQDICLSIGKEKSDDPVIHVLLAVFGFSIVVDALQQVEINKYFGDDTV